MPKCSSCGQLLHANLCNIVNESPTKTDYQCWFCKLGKDKLTIQNNKTGKERIIDKKEESKKYIIYLKQLSENNEGIKKIIKGEKSSRIIT